MRILKVNKPNDLRGGCIDDRKHLDVSELECLERHTERITRSVVERGNRTGSIFGHR